MVKVCSGVCLPACRGAERRGGDHRLGVQQRSHHGQRLQHPAGGQGPSFRYASILIRPHGRQEAAVTVVVDVVVVVVLVSTDLELYNEALKVIQDFPQFYPFKVAASG